MEEMKMKKRTKRAVSMVLAAGMIASLVVGASADEGFHESGLPITDEPVTLTVLTTRWGNMGDSFTANKFLTDLEENSNVHIEWQVQSLNDWSEQKGIMLASGELPDIIMGFRTFNDSDIMNNMEMFQPLDDLIDQYMPNYKKALEEIPELKKMATFSGWEDVFFYEKSSFEAEIL